MWNNVMIAGAVLVVVAYIWGLLGGSLERGTFAHQQIVAVCVGIFIAKAAAALVPKQLRK